VWLVVLLVETVVVVVEVGDWATEVLVVVVGWLLLVLVITLLEELLKADVVLCWTIGADDVVVDVGVFFA
jgi:hypothetical protein